MKRILIYMFSFQLLAFFGSCKKEVMEYNGREGVYFAVQHGNPLSSENSWPYQPYSNVDFVRLGGDEAEISLKVMITGPVKDYDRTFRVQVNPDSTTAIPDQHYEAPNENWVIPAGAVSTTIQVLLKRTPDLQQSDKTLGLRLVATNQFALSFPEWDAIPSLNGGTVVPKFNASLHTLRINDVMVQPAVWNGRVNATTGQETGLFGQFTRRKMDFLIENLGLTYNDFSDPAQMPLPRMSLLSNDGAAILKQRYDAGDPVLEEDGRLMFMGNVPWKSYVGVPWVPGS